MKTNDGKVPRRLRIYSSGFTARCSGFASVSNFTWFMPRVSMEYPSIASPQQCCWHSELLPLPWLFPLNSLLATWLFSELSWIRAVFRGFIPCAFLEAVVFKVSTQGGKIGRNRECRSDVFPWKGDGVFPFLQGETWSWLGAFQELLRSSSQTANWALGSALTGCFIFVKIALNWTFFLSSPVWEGGAYNCFLIRCSSLSRCSAGFGFGRESRIYFLLVFFTVRELILSSHLHCRPQPHPLSFSFSI